MGLDIGALTEGLSFLGGVITILERLKGLLPDGSGKEAVIEALEKAEQAERKLKTVEAQAAQDLGGELCWCAFPPQIMLSKDRRHWKCPKCGSERTTGPATAVAEPEPQKRGLFH
jgi:hypothetical protein